MLVKVIAASTAAGGWHLLRADPFLARFAYGLLKPKYKILGASVAGRVEAVGRNVTQFRPGARYSGTYPPVVLAHLPNMLRRLRSHSH